MIVEIQRSAFPTDWYCMSIDALTGELKVPIVQTLEQRYDTSFSSCEYEPMC